MASGRTGIVTWLAVGMSLALAVMMLRMAATNRDLASDATAAYREVRAARLERLALVERLRQIPLERGFLQGTEVGSGVRMQVDEPRNGVYYVVKPSCAACALNYPFLDSLAMIAPGFVTGLLWEGDSATAIEYLKREHVAFPLLRSVSGKLLNAIPRHGVPLTVLISGDSIRAITGGQLSTDDQRMLVELAKSAWSSDAVSDRN